VCRYEVVALNESRSEFEGGNYAVEDRSGEVSDFEVESSINHPVKSKAHVWESPEEQSQYNGLVSYGRRLYDNLRTQFGKTHDAAYAAALAKFGTFEEFQAKREQERAQAEAEETSARLAQEAADAEAQRVQEAEQTLQDARANALADEEAAIPTEASSDLTLAQNAALVPDLARDLADTSLGHKPLARKWSNLTTESSVRRYRKANGIQVSTWTKVKDALS
jgi:hypothetical protein